MRALKQLHQQEIHKIRREVEAEYRTRGHTIFSRFSFVTAVHQERVESSYAPGDANN